MWHVVMAVLRKIAKEYSRMFKKYIYICICKENGMYDIKMNLKDSASVLKGNKRII